MSKPLDKFERVWAMDFEFQQQPGEVPTVHCLVARCFRTGQTVRQWISEDSTPFRFGQNDLLVAYFASAELGCFLSLGWELPKHVLDLYCEWRAQTNGLSVGRGLLDAAMTFGLDVMESSEKSTMRDLAIRGAPFTDDEQRALVDYCEQDVITTSKLLEQMLPTIDLERAILRGGYMVSVARMENTGIPIDVGTLSRLKSGWSDVVQHLVHKVDPICDVFEGTSFRTERFARYLVKHDIAWPRLDSGKLALDDDTFRQMAKRHPLEIGRFHELRHTLGQMRLSDLAVGSDGRNRVMLSPFATKTSRNAPSTSRFVFGPSTWLRSLIRPKQGRAVAYVDWKQQEFGIAGALSQDSNMVEAYASGDPYLAFAIQSGSVPPTATKQTHGAQRALFKICVLAVAYGQTEWGLAHAINKSPVHARELLRLHQRTYPKFYQWSQRAVDSAILNGEIQSVFGWKLRVGQDTKPRTLQNFPAQSNGAEMMRIAAILLHQAGIQVCAPIHDAFLVEGPADEIQDVVETARSCMRRASEIVLDGFPLDTDFEVVTYPDRYSDERGETMWKAVSELIDNPAPCEPIGD